MRNRRERLTRDLKDQTLQSALYKIGSPRALMIEGLLPASSMKAGGWRTATHTGIAICSVISPMSALGTDPRRLRIPVMHYLNPASFHFSRRVLPEKGEDAEGRLTLLRSAMAAQCNPHTGRRPIACPYYYYSAL